MRKIEIKVYLICFFLGFIALCSCSSDEKSEVQNADEAISQIVLVFEDSVASRFFKQRKSVFKYMDDNQLPVEIAFNSKEAGSEIVLKTTREFLDLVYRDNSQVEFTYFLQKAMAYFY